MRPEFRLSTLFVTVALKNPVAAAQLSDLPLMSGDTHLPLQYVDPSQSRVKLTWFNVAPEEDEQALGRVVEAVKANGTDLVVALIWGKGLQAERMVNMCRLGWNITGCE